MVFFVLLFIYSYYILFLPISSLPFPLSLSLSFSPTLSLPLSLSLSLSLSRFHSRSLVLFLYLSIYLSLSLSLSSLVSLRDFLLLRFLDLLLFSLLEISFFFFLFFFFLARRPFPKFEIVNAVSTTYAALRGFLYITAFSSSNGCNRVSLDTSPEDDARFSTRRRRRGSRE